MFAIKITLHVNGRTGSKFVTRNSGKPHTVKTREKAELLIEKCKASAITGIRESYEIVKIS